jgi:hypothetical protein
MMEQQQEEGGGGGGGGASSAESSANVSDDAVVDNSSSSSSSSSSDEDLHGGGASSAGVLPFFSLKSVPNTEPDFNSYLSERGNLAMVAIEDIGRKKAKAQACEDRFRQIAENIDGIISSISCLKVDDETLSSELDEIGVVPRAMNEATSALLVKGSTEFGDILSAHQRKLMVEMEEVAKAKVQYEVDENLLQKYFEKVEELQSSGDSLVQKKESLTGFVMNNML